VDLRRAAKVRPAPVMSVRPMTEIGQLVTRIPLTGYVIDMDAAGGTISLRRLIWIGPATIAASVLAVSIVRALIVALMPLDSWPGSIMALHEPEVATGSPGDCGGRPVPYHRHRRRRSLVERLADAVTVLPTVKRTDEESAGAVENQ